MKAHIKQSNISKSVSNVDDSLKSIPMDALQEKLEISLDGLTQKEAQIRHIKYGPNEIAEKKSNPFLKFLSYFWGPIPSLRLFQPHNRCDSALARFYYYFDITFF